LEADVLLALDTATKTIGIAVHDGSTVLAEVLWSGKGYHTVELAPEIGLIMKRIGITVDHLTGIAVALGPGSFTGLRIGMAFAKGLALAHKLDLIGILTHEILAQGQPIKSKDMITLTRAGRSRFSTVSYSWQDGWKQADQPVNQSIEDLLASLDRDCYLCGEFGAHDRDRLAQNPLVELASPADCVRRPAVLAELAWQQVRSGSVSHPANLVPVYIRSASGL
jgi:tRNA threonylcarbamoyladenosine biosynthesis protein TsaB